MREFHIESPYPHKNPELFRRVRECIRRRSVLGPWKKVCLERLRYQELKSPKKDESPASSSTLVKIDDGASTDAVDPSTSVTEVEPTEPQPTNPIQTQAAVEIQMLEEKLQMLQDQKHVQFGLLKTILIEEARAKARAAPPPPPVPLPPPMHPPGHPSYPTDGMYVAPPLPFGAGAS
ncbi:hypothetical protein AaE_009009 [Aphanomyces astaci]|uniref:Uncharacterized protein n=1 Tax=Aphanomyces astaci TaxID=112090 RepID=A0A6A4ZYE3_APHAT|nr:hypothetical protein AaE_009009 [Aphanomyces astaci]